MAHVTLIRPPRVCSATVYGEDREPSLGLAYIVAALEAAGNELTVIDAVGEAPDNRYPAAYPGLVAYGLTIPQIVDRIPPGTDAIGVSVMFSVLWPHVGALVRAIATRLPGTPIILGGEHATAVWEYLLATYPEVTVCVLGEGEVTAVELAEWLDGKRALDSIAGIAIRTSTGPQRTQERPRLRQIEKLPRPAWHRFPLEAYFARGLCGQGDRYIGRSLPIVATRGCPFRCTFCSSASMWTTRYVLRPVTDVADEIQGHVERYGVSNVDFEDLSPFVKRDWILEFCRELSRRGLGITFQLPVGTRSEALDREVLQAMSNAGCKAVRYAPESGSPQTIARIKKRVQLDRMPASIRAAAEMGMTVKASFIIGFPFETRRDMWDTIRFCATLARNGARDVYVYSFSPYPGSELANELRQQGVLPPLGDEYFASLALQECRQRVRVNKNVSPLEILGCQVTAMLLAQVVVYAKEPARLPRTIWRVLSGNYAARDSMVDRALAAVLPTGVAGWVRQVGTRRRGTKLTAAQAPR